MRTPKLQQEEGIPPYSTAGLRYSHEVKLYFTEEKTMGPIFCEVYVEAYHAFAD